MEDINLQHTTTPEELIEQLIQQSQTADSTNNSGKPTEAFKKADKEDNKTLSDDEQFTKFKNIIKDKMVEQGSSPEEVARAEKFLDVRKQVKSQLHAVRAKNTAHISPDVSINMANLAQTMSAEDLDKYSKMSEEVIAEMLLMRKQSKNPPVSDVPGIQRKID